MAEITKSALLALIASMEDDESPIDEPSSDILTATRFQSLGFVAVGSGSDPGEGTVIDVPTKAGKLQRVRTVQSIDMSPFSSNFDGDWAYTYKRLKRGENDS